MTEIRTASENEFNAVQGFYYELIDDMVNMEYHPKWQKGIYPADSELRDALHSGEMFI